MIIVRIILPRRENASGLRLLQLVHLLRLLTCLMMKAIMKTRILLLLLYLLLLLPRLLHLLLPRLLHLLLHLLLPRLLLLHLHESWVSVVKNAAASQDKIIVKNNLKIVVKDAWDSDMMMIMMMIIHGFQKHILKMARADDSDMED